MDVVAQLPWVHNLRFAQTGWITGQVLAFDPNPP
jgi:hypothetical protein